MTAEMLLTYGDPINRVLTLREYLLIKMFC